MGELIDLYQEWLENLSQPRQAVGCFFIFSETVQPYFWDSTYYPKVTLSEAWKVLCKGWLNKVYKFDLVPLYPYVLKGIVEPGKILLGNDCPFYLDDICFNFSLPFSNYEVDPSLAVDVNIPEELALILRLSHKNCPYFERLPAKLQFRKKDYGDLVERSAVKINLIEKSKQIIKVKRFGSLPNLIKTT